MDETLNLILSKLESLETGQKAMQAGQEKLSARLDHVEESLERVKISQMRVELEQYPRIDAALDGVAGMQEKFDKLDNLEAKQENHGNRIFALEQVL